MICGWEGSSRPMRVSTRFNCYTHWWMCLPSIPPSRESVDWWADPSFVRVPRYRRLWRLWADTTRFQAPKEDPERPHEFARRSHSVHLIAKVFENFAVFAPSEWLR